jgi:hypothetical protein
MIIGEPVATNPVYLEIIDFFASGTTPQAVVDFQPSPAAQHRALELLDLAKEDRLTPEQESELEHFTELEHILRMAKARARQILDAKQWLGVTSNDLRLRISHDNFRLIFRAVLRDEVECLPAAG